MEGWQNLSVHYFSLLNGICEGDRKALILKVAAKKAGSLRQNAVLSKAESLMH